MKILTSNVNPFQQNKLFPSWMFVSITSNVNVYTFHLSLLTLVFQYKIPPLVERIHFIHSKQIIDTHKLKQQNCVWFMHEYYDRRDASS